jgi:serine/threonine-protein kinase
MTEYDSARRLAVGSIFRRSFRIEAILGEGGMGRVFAAHDINLDRPVAIKLLLPQPDREEAAARFLREAQVLARLSSENTVRIYEVGRDDRGAPYIVMERARGCDLDALVGTRGPLPVDEAIEYIRQVCAVLAEAHAYGIVHRDVKPGNILVDQEAVRGPLVKIVDFGVAKARPAGQDASGLTAVSTLLGTPQYMAPEQLYSAREVDPRADVWGIGATLYFILAGEPPFDGEDLSELMDRIQHGPTPALRRLRPEVPAYVEEAVQRCLHRDPHGRFASVRDVARALRVATGWSDRLPTLGDDSGSLYDATTVMTGAVAGSSPLDDDDPSSARDHTLPFAQAPRVDVGPPSGQPPSVPAPMAPPPVSLQPAPPPPAVFVAAEPLRMRWLWLLAALGVGVGIGVALMRLLGR